MGLRRYFDHWLLGLRGAGGTFPASVRAVIEKEIGVAEESHQGEIRFAIQAALSLRSIWHGDGARSHAIGTFASLGVWDTAANNGVLIYILLADRAVEFVADRGISAQVPDSEWQALCNEVQDHFRRGEFEAGSVHAVRGVAQRLARHFPAGTGHTNELPNQPVLL